MYAAIGPSLSTVTIAIPKLTQIMETIIFTTLVAAACGEITNDRACNSLAMGTV